MKLILKITVIIWAIHLDLKAQIYFNKGYATSQVEGGTSIIEDTGYLILGQVVTSTYRSFYFIKIDLNGDTVWTRNYPKSQYAYYTGSSNSLIKTSDNNYAFGGSIMNFQDSTNAGDLVLVKFDLNGDTLWTKSYGGGNRDIGNMVLESSDNGFVLIGATKSFGNGQSDFYFIKTDSVGNFQYQKTYGTSVQEEAYSAIQTLEGGYMLSGHKNNQFYIVKTDNIGNLQWQQTYSGTAGPCFVKQLEDSSYILTGAKQISGFAGEAYIIKINKLGGVIWQNHYGSSLVNDWFYTQPIILSDGSIVVGGQQMLGSIPIGLLVKTDSAGNQQWLRTYYANPNIDNYVFDLKPTSDNGFIITGSCYITTQDAWAVKVDSNGCEVAGCNVGVEEETTELNNLCIYPNPTNGIFTISATGTKLKEVRVMDVMGRIVISEQLIVNSTSAAIDMSGYAKGVYFVQITDGSAGSATGVVNRKIVLQ